MCRQLSRKLKERRTESKDLGNELATENAKLQKFTYEFHIAGWWSFTCVRVCEKLQLVNKYLNYIKIKHLHFSLV